MEYWTEQFARTRKRNFFHAIVTGLVFVGEKTAVAITIRLYPDPENEKGVIGILRKGDEKARGVRYSRTGGLREYFGNEASLIGTGSKQYNWTWIEDRFMLTRITTILSTGAALEKAGNYHEVY